MLWALSAALLVTRELTADVKITETIANTTAGRKRQGERVTFIKGLKMRVDTVLDGERIVRVYDVSAGKVMFLDAKHREAKVKDFAAIKAAAERKIRTRNVTTSMVPTGHQKEFFGNVCEEHTFAIRVPLSKDAQIALLMTGTAWIARTAPGADEYVRFAKVASERGLELGGDSDNLILVALAHAQTELYRMIGELRGVPFAIDTNIKFEKGALGALLNKVGSGTRISNVTALSVEPISDHHFTVPDDWRTRMK